MSSNIAVNDELILDDMPPLEIVNEQDPAESEQTQAASNLSSHLHNRTRRSKRKREHAYYQSDEDLSISPTNLTHNQHQFTAHLPYDFHPEHLIFDVDEKQSQSHTHHLEDNESLLTDDSDETAVSTSNSESSLQYQCPHSTMISSAPSGSSRRTSVVELSSDDDDDDSDIEAIDVKRVVDLTDESNPLLSDSPARRVQTRIRYINVIVPQPAAPVDQPPAHPCPVCLSECVDMSAPKCGHIACATCLERTIELYHRCPVCRHKASMRDVRRLFI